ncbi:MAG: aldo/keto reductase [Anaerolineales bacterium]|nr:aldo/keto reductase [Anaerolineales bacterium]
MNNAVDKVDPNSIPKRKLYTGAEIPAIGLGTFGSDHYTADQIAGAVKGAAEIGYRHFDCAAVYGNEKEIGEAFQEILSGNISRDELWVTSKLWNDKHAEEDVIPACKKTLQDLRLEYLDLYLIHWPFPNHHSPGVDGSSRDPHAVPYIHENYMKTWRQLEELVVLGLVRHVGTSNMTIPKMELLLRDARIKPVANQMELHPHFQQPGLFQFCLDNDIVPIGYSPIGSPGRPERDKTAEDTVDTEDPVIVRIAERLGVHPALVCIKWAVQRGQIPIPFSVKREKYQSNLEAIVKDPLTETEMKEIAKFDKNCRLIKGQVFLWEGAQSWEDLWDLDGHIVKKY